MPDRHKANPVTFRPPEGDRAWLYAHAEATGRSVGAILTEALQRARAAHPSRPEPANSRHERDERRPDGDTDDGGHGEGNPA